MNHPTTVPPSPEAEAEIRTRLAARFLDAIRRSDGTTADALAIFAAEAHAEGVAMGWPASTMAGLATVCGEVAADVINVGRSIMAGRAS